MIEAMVALLVMSFGMVALVGLLSNLRQNADIAKQRGEAMRIAQSEIAKIRAFSVLDNGGDATLVDYQHNVLETVNQQTVPVENSNATFVVTRTAEPLETDDSTIQGHTVSVTVGWKNRHGLDETFRLDAVLAKVDPVFSSALSIAPPSDGVRTSDGRNPVIPADARNLRNGSSVFRPAMGGTVVWVFNNASGVITGKCQVDANTSLTALTPRDLETCSNNSLAYLVSGTIQFSASNPANPAIPNGVARPVSVYVALLPSQYKARNAAGALALVPGGDYPASAPPECFTDAPSSSSTASQTFVNYNCLVFPNNQPTKNWWGQVLLRDLDIGNSATQFRVCRYSADYNGNGYTYRLLNATENIFQIDNEEHPEVYRGVSYSLSKQNFLVVRGDVSCPTAAAVDQAAGVFVDYSTVQLQPAVQSSP